MRTTQKNGLYECCRCHRELPKEYFYVANREKGLTDRYCKDCRKAVSMQQYMKRSGQGTPPRQYPLITEESDPKRRMALIMNAVKTVKESVKRKSDADRENTADA